MRRACPHCGVDHGALRGVPRLDVAEAAAGRAWLLKAERTSTAETVWYRDRPMRELSKRIEEAYAYVLAAAVRRIERFVSEQVVGEAVKLSKARRRFHLLSPQQLALIQEILGEHHAALVAGMIDVEALPPTEAQRLLDRGVVAQDLAMVLAPVVKQDRPPDAMRMIDDAFLYGRDIAKRTQSARREIERLTYAEWKALPREPLTESERAALTWARNSAATRVKGLGNRVASDFATIAIEADRELRIEQERAIREEVAEGIAERKAWRKVASALGDRTGDWSRDLARIAATEQQEAMTEGQAAVMKRRAGGEDVRVAKRPNPDACEACLAAYTQNGRPRIFWLEELRANGSNVGKKRKDWKPTLGPLHPWCFPAGTLIDAEGGAVPIEAISVGDLVRTHRGRLRAVQRLSQRIHRGELVVLTAGGDLLESTPEHPLLTQRGWIRASDVEIGDHLFTDPHPAGAATDAHDVETEHSGESVLRGILGALARARMPVGVCLDEYSDLGQSEIEAVGTDRDRWDRLVSSINQEIEQGALVGSQRAVALAGLGRLHLFRDGSRFSASRVVSRLRETLSLFRTALLVDDHELSAVAAHHDAGTHESTRDRATRGPVELRKLVDALARFVAARDLVLRQAQSARHDTVYHGAPVTSTGRRPFEGAVYNFAVDDDESYVAGGFVVHNCACELIEVPDGWGFDEAGDLMPEELLRSALRDLSLRKAARVTHRPRAYGVGSTLSIHVADPELRAVVEDVARRTPAQVFRPDVGVLLITTDHRRQTTPLDDLDFAYWSGHEIRIQQGIDPARAARVLEHEIAHSLNVWLLGQMGSLDAVRDWHAKLDEVSRDEGRVSDYASREPIENAAEVLRLYLYQRGRLRLRWPRQFAMVHESMRGIWDLPEGA